jgi:endoglucanase Acf2
MPLPPPEEDGEHAHDGDGHPYDPKEETSRNPWDPLEGMKWYGKIHYKKEKKPAYPSPQDLSHRFTSD